MYSDVRYVTYVSDLSEVSYVFYVRECMNGGVLVYLNCFEHFEC